MSTASPTPLEYPFDSLPAPGHTIEIAPGLRWVRMRLPFALDHMRELVEQVFEERAWKAKAAPDGVIAAERLRMERLLARYLAWARTNLRR